MREDDHDGGTIPRGYIVAGWSHDVAWSINESYDLSQRCADRTFAALASQRLAWLANLQLRNLRWRFSCQTSDRSAQRGFCAGSTRLGCEALGT
eukprot:SAG25_NODE_136_length_14215_cov_15.693114_3_plen_94_part_00